MKNSVVTAWRSIYYFLLMATVISLPGVVLAQGMLNLTIHYIQASPNPNKESYNVSAFVSILDDKGYPVPNLSISSFSVFEDSQPAILTGVQKAAEVPVNLILVFDTSGSMINNGLPPAKKAGTNFIQKLGASDQVAIIGFNDKVGKSGGFSNDHAAAQKQLNELQATPNAGTCLYDAAYQAVELANTLAPGRRAVILLTDGRDETAVSKVCSSYTVDDVIKQANGASGNIPIYAIGLGKNIDENTLRRISGLTGGEYLSSPDSSQLETMFDKLNQQITGQYQINYDSSAAPGPHKLAVEVSIGSEKDQSTREFSLPVLPARIKISSPGAGKTLGNQVDISTILTGNEDDVRAVRFDVAGATVGTVTTQPYNLSLDLSKYPAGNLEIRVVALGEGSQELSQDSINVIVANQAAAVIPTVIVPTPVPTPVSVWSSATSPGVLGIAGLTLLLGIGAVVFLKRNKKPAADSSSSNWAPESGYSSAEATLDGFDLNNDAILATLSVLSSDDPTKIGLKIPISTETTRLGRDRAKNEVAFENDRPVSREHATLTLNSAGLFMLAEVVRASSPGQPESAPTYGTFVNETKITAPLALFSGDQIRLGKRLTLLFETPKGNRPDDDATQELVSEDIDGAKTMLDPLNGDSKTQLDAVEIDSKTLLNPIDNNTHTQVS